MLAQRLKYILLFLCFSFCLKAQTNLPEQDCIHAIPLCQNIYSTTTAYTGTGIIPNEINPLYSCLSTGEKNDVWYIFTVQSSGEINFTITPFSATDDYDWAVFNLSNSNCSAIFLDSSLQVSCNYDANTGCGGATGPNGLMTACGQSEPTIPAIAGQTYVVNVSNYSSSQSGYTINFSASTAMIYDAKPPEQTQVMLGCTQTQFVVSFNEAVSCQTISAAGNDFVVKDSVGNILQLQNVKGKGCSVNNPYIDSIEINLQQQLADYATYYLIAENGNDGNTVSDKCGNFFAAGDTVAILLIQNNMQMDLGNDLQICKNETAPVLQTTGSTASLYQWSYNGQLIGNTPSCTVNDTGQYILFVSLGEMCFDADTVLVTEKPALVFNLGNDTTICNGQTLPAFNCNVANAQQYQWYLNGNAAGTNSQIFQPASAGTITAEVFKANFCKGMDTVIVNSVAAPQINLGSDAGICNGDTVVLASPSSFLFYEWRKGSLILSTDSFITAYATGNYILRAGINSGCYGMDTIGVFNKAVTQVLLGTDITTCIYDALPQLTATSNANVFEWYYNDSVINSTTSSVQSVGAGTYVAMAQAGNACKGADTLLLSVAEILPVDFGSDTAVCMQSSYALNATVLSNGIYHWYVDGVETENHTAVFQIAEEGFYKMIFNGNTGCTAGDSVFISSRLVPGMPEVNCAQQNGNQKIFTWQPVNGATNYEVSTDNGNSWTKINSTTDLTFTTQQSISKIWVRAIGDELCNAGVYGESKFCEVNTNTILTPDGDGVNDVFYINGAQNPIELSLYDVAGKEIYRNHDYRNNFDGKKLSRGIYIFRIKPAKAEYVTGKFLLMK